MRLGRSALMIFGAAEQAVCRRAILVVAPLRVQAPEQSEVDQGEASRSEGRFHWLGHVLELVEMARELVRTHRLSGREWGASVLSMAWKRRIIRGRKVCARTSRARPAQVGPLRRDGRRGSWASLPEDRFREAFLTRPSFVHEARLKREPEQAEACGASFIML